PGPAFTLDDISISSSPSKPLRRLRIGRQEETVVNRYPKRILRECNLFELEAEEEDLSLFQSDSEDEQEDLDQDLESLIDDRPTWALTQLPPSGNEPLSQNSIEGTGRSFHYQQLVPFSQSPVYLKKARERGLVLSTIDDQMREINARRI